MLDLFQSKYGKNLTLDVFIKDFEDVINSYIKEEDAGSVLNEILHSMVVGDDLEHPLHGDFNEIRESIYSDSYGEGAYAEHWFIKRVLISNDDIGLMFLCNFGGTCDTDGGLEFDGDSEVFVYEYTSEKKEFIKDYLMEEQAKKLEREIKRKEYKLEHEKLKAVEKQRVSNLKSSISKQLLEDGFTRCISDKGNLTSKYYFEMYLFEDVLYNKFEDVLQYIESKENKPLSDYVKIKLYEITKRSTKLSLNGKGVLEIVKKDTSNDFYSLSYFYTSIVNTLNNIDFKRGYSSNEKFNYYKDNKYNYITFLNKELEIKKEDKRIRDENFSSIMSDLFRSFN